MMKKDMSNNGENDGKTARSRSEVPTRKQRESNEETAPEWELPEWTAPDLENPDWEVPQWTAENLPFLEWEVEEWEVPEWELPEWPVEVLDWRDP